MKFLVFILFLSFFSQISLAKEITAITHDGKDINELQLIIEDPQNCLKVKDIENEIKYIFSNSNIRIVDSSPYKLYVQTNFLIDELDNFCWGDISLEIYSYVWDGINIIGSNVVWNTGTIILKSPPYESYILNSIAQKAKSAIVWINDNK
jgi:hypothetical protein